MSFAGHIKGLSKDAVIYGAGFALNSLVGLITAPISTRIFAPEDYGVIALVQTMMGFLSVLIGLNLSSGVFRHYFEYDDARTRKRILSTALYFLAASGLFYAAVVWAAAPHLQQFLLVHQSGIHEGVRQYDYVGYFRILSLGVFFSILDVYFRSLLRMNRHPYQFTALSAGLTFLNLGLFVWLVYYLRYGIEGALWCGVLASAVGALAGFFMNVRHFQVHFSPGILRQLFSYCLPQFPSGILGWLLVQGSPFLLNYFSTLAQQGEYAIAVRVASLILLFTTAFRLAWDPFALSIMKRPDAPVIYGRIYGLFYAGVGLVGAAAALYAKPILMILSPPPYHAAYALVFVAIAAYVIQEGNNILGIGIGISKKTRFISYAQAIAFLCYLACAVVLIPLIGAWGAITSLLVGIYAQAVAYYYFARPLFPVPYRFWRTSAFVLGLFLIAGIQTRLVWSLDLWAAIAVAVLFTPVLALYAFRLGLSVSERASAIRLLAQQMAGRRRAAS